MKNSTRILPQCLINPVKFPPQETPWWIEVQTKFPHCTYYFGPFDSLNEAQKHQPGYIEDLVAEKAQGISFKINQKQPILLTSCER